MYKVTIIDVTSDSGADQVYYFVLLINAILI